MPFIASIQSGDEGLFVSPPVLRQSAGRIIR